MDGPKNNGEYEQNSDETASLHRKTSFFYQGPFCRLCLNNNANLRPVFPSPRIDDNYIIKIIDLVADIRLLFEDDYNSFVCCDCLEKLDEFHRYKEIWQSNDGLLRTFRDKGDFENPVPVEQFMEISEQNVEDIGNTEETGLALEPIPIVSIPIEHLMEEPEIERKFHSEKSDLGQKSYDYEWQQNITVKNEAVDIKHSIEMVPIIESTIGNNCNPKPYVQEKHLNEINIKTREALQKDKLIKKLMRRIRRETLSPQKTKKRHKKYKKSKDATLDMIDLTDIDKG